MKEDGEAMGTLELHGVKKPVTVKYEKMNVEGKTITFNSKFNIKITDFAIDIPSFQGITVADEVEVSVNFKAQNL